MNKQDIKDSSFINISHHMANTRCYYITRTKYYFIYTSNLDEIRPVKIKSAINSAEYLFQLLKNDPKIHMDVCYPETWPTNKLMKLHDLIEASNEQDVNKDLLFRYLLLLI